MFRITLNRILALKLLAVALWFAAAPRPWALGLFFVGDLWILANLFIPSTRGLVPVSTRFATPRREVWLTIDDGPDPADTPQILEHLDAHGAKATFFLVGERAAAHPDLVADILRRGHEVGHHTHTHPAGLFWAAPSSAVRRELDRGIAALAPARPRRFRPPVGIKNLFLGPLLAARGLRCIMWSIRSRDSFARDPGRVVRRLMDRVKPGDILLLHEGASLHPSIRIHAIAQLLAALTAAGYRGVIPDDAQLR